MMVFSTPFWKRFDATAQRRGFVRLTALLPRLAGLLLASGLMLVRSQPRGVTWSHRYAWTSIATKTISLVVTVAVVLPAMQRMMDEAMAFPPGMPAGAADKMTGIMKSFTAISTVATPLISCIYPALALFFLSRPAVKEWAARPR